MIQSLNPPQFGREFEFLNGDETGLAISPGGGCSRCDSSSRSGASGKSSGSSRCGVQA